MSWDAVVIGSGIGGLSAAVALARAGQRVLVLEQHYLPGGWSHSFTLGGYTFNPGMHYVGELEEGRILRRLLEGLGVARHLRFHEIALDHLVVGDERYDVPKGRSAHAEQLCRRFPRERAGIARYFETCGALVDEITHIDELLRFPRVLSLPWSAPTLTRWGTRKLSSLIDACGVEDPKARALLAAQCGGYGLGPSEAPVPVHVMLVEHYQRGAYYPCGGGRRVVSALIKELRAHGGDIRVSTRVEHIVTEHGRAVGVELASGEQVRAKNVISNADAALTYEKLLAAPHARAQRWWARRVKHSVSALSLFAAVDIDLRALGYDNGNHWWYAHEDLDGIYRRMTTALPAGDIEALFVSINSLKDPHPQRHGHHTLEMFTYVPYDPFARWSASTLGERPADYVALKQTLTDKMLRAAESVIPNLRKHLTFCELGTPLTNDFYCQTRRGACYGVAKTRGQIGPFSFSTRGAIPGLYLCGASTFSHGLAGAALSGVFAAGNILGLPRPMELLGPADGSLRIDPIEETEGLRAA